MNKKLFISLIFTFFLALCAGSVFAAETLDIPQNTNIKETAGQPEEKTEEPKVEEKETTKKEEQNISSKEEIKEETKEKKFFAKTKKDEKNDENSPQEATEVIVDSETIEYFPERHEFEAVGDAKVSFPSENSVLYADKLVFNHDTNYVKGYGNVVLVKEGQKINGEYIQVDLNENNAMMTHPVLNHMMIKIRAKQGIVCDAKTEAIEGNVTFNDKVHYKFTSKPIFGFDKPMMDEVIPKYFYVKEKYDNRWRLKAKTIVIDSKRYQNSLCRKNETLYRQRAGIY